MGHDVPVWLGHDVPVWLGHDVPVWLGHNVEVTTLGAPAPITDRPLRLIDLLDGAFHALRQRPRVLALCAMWIAVPASLIQIIIERTALGSQGSSLATVFGVRREVTSDELVSSGLVLYLVIGWFVTAASGVAVARVVGGWSEGRDTTAREAIGFAIRRLPVVTGAFVVSHVIAGIGWVVLLVPGFIALLLFSLVSPVIALEDPSNPWHAITRSARLARARWGTVLGLMSALLLVSAAMQGGIALFFLTFGIEGDGIALAINAAVALLVSFVMVPLNGAAMCLLYLDARFRDEGFDLELRAGRVFPLDRPSFGTVGVRG